VFSRRIFFFAEECIWKAPSRAKFSRNQIYRGKHTRKSYETRELDPKYSRLIGTAPALGGYIPAAGKANAKDMANLPVMGGIFNPNKCRFVPLRRQQSGTLYRPGWEDNIYAWWLF